MKDLDDNIRLEACLQLGCCLRIIHKKYLLVKGCQRKLRITKSYYALSLLSLEKCSGMINTTGATLKNGARQLTDGLPKSLCAIVACRVL